MLGLMQNWPLLCHRIIDHAAANHAERPIISRSIEGALHTTTYAEVRARAIRLAQRLDKEGIRLGDRVATLAWNTWRHLEAWYGIMGIGAVYHTVNPRLFPDQIAWIANHAGDRLMLVDLTFVPLLEKLADKLSSIERYVVLCDGEHMPQTSLKNAVPYEAWIAEVDGDFAWKTFDENTAAGMCYTSGTTGNPKGVVYSHRSNVLHGLMANTADMKGYSSRDVVMPVVPMFHANCWAMMFAAPMAGASLSPRAMAKTFQDVYGVEVIHAWGMTEMSPLGTACTLKPEYASLAGEARLDIQQKQGQTPLMVEMKITDDAGRRLPWDGKTFGRLKVRGPCVARAYYQEEDNILDEEGFFDTGDVCTIDRYGYMQVTDRAKDVIKSGGEWISSIDLENLAIGHPKVAEAAVIGVKHPKWEERPLLVIILKKGQSATRDEILTFMRGKVASWWIPDEVVFVDEIPHTATGKIQKTVLRERFKDFVLPTAVAAQ